MSTFTSGDNGGGISGLCLAVALSKYPGIQVDVYEAAERFKEIGAGVMIWSKTWRILELLGLASDFSKVAHAPQDGSLGIGFDYRRSDQTQEGFRFHLVQMPHGCIRFHRAHFLDVFVDHLPDGVAHFGKRLVSYSQLTTSEPGSPITLTFSDNSSVVCDLLVGCDGIKSFVRKQMLEGKAKEGNPELLDLITPRWSGTIAYRGLIPVDHIPKNKSGGDHRTITSPMMYCGQSKHIVSYSISRGSIVNVIAFASEPDKEGSPYKDQWVEDCSPEELLACYADWEPEVQDLIHCIEKPTCWGLHHLKPLPFYVTDTVALVGDAAHAMVPHQGAGAGQAIEDAYVLACIPGQPSTNKSNLSAALVAYERIRLPVANSVLLGSYESGKMYEFNSSFGEDYENLGPAIEGQWKWIQQTTPEEDVENALHIMKDLCM